MTGRRLEEILTRRPLTAVEWGLDRTRELLARLGDPQEAFRSVHVGGTNGKGSAAAMAAAVLGADGRRVGLYTSPELVDLADRYRVDGRTLDRELLDACAERVGPEAAAVDATFFEAATALAFLAFREAGVEWTVAEVGLGGRLDATNVLEPEAAVITTVARDHERFLGTGLAEIAREKAGILKPGVPAAAGRMPPEAMEAVEERAREVGAPLARLGRDARLEAVAVRLAGTRFRYRSGARPDGLELEIPLPGVHQAENAATALLALESLEEPPADRAVREGLAGLRWRGRFEVRRREGVTWVLDAGHNPASAAALADTLDRTRPPEPRILLAAVLGDKAWRSLLAPLRVRTRRAVLTVAPSSPADRRWDPADAAAELGEGAEAVDDFDRALDRARELAGEGTVVVAGSCYTVGDALRRLDPDPGDPAEADAAPGRAGG